MHARVTEHIRAMVQMVHDNPALQEIIHEDPKAEIDPLIQRHIQNTAFLVGYDFLKLNLRAAQMLEEKKYDLIKIRRRIEEYLRKHASGQDIIKLALFYGVSLK
jgi:hypothetical protein